MFSWEKTATDFLDGIGLRSIKSKIIVFSLLATLIPTVTMGWLSYRNNRRSIDESIVHELAGLTSQASREVELWLQERRYELKVLSSSYEVSENLEAVRRPGVADRDRGLALRRLGDYLESIGGKFLDYEELFVVDAEAQVVASSAPAPRGTGLREGWLARAEAGETVVGDPQWDDVSESGLLVIAQPIRNVTGAFLGVMAAKVDFDRLDPILARFATVPSHEIYLVTEAGEVLIGSREFDGRFMSSRLPEPTASDLFGGKRVPLEFRSFRGKMVLGALAAVPGIGWGVVAEKDRASAYAATARLRNVTLTVIAVVGLAIGVAAYLLGIAIARPLARLSRAATKVAGGDLDLNLPLYGRSEISYTTRVFNEMVARLRALRDENAAINQALRERNVELRTLSITDGLTGLYNRTYLPELLAKELARSRRHERQFSILMVDIDHFKRFNDAHGHQAGDEMLKAVAGVLGSVVRASDLAARYGGEEFLVLLSETGSKGAMTFAEALRRKIEKLRLKRRSPVTASIGVATFSEHGDEMESIISQADAALYRCKRNGRNQVTLARPRRKRKTQAATRG